MPFFFVNLHKMVTVFGTSEKIIGNIAISILIEKGKKIISIKADNKHKNMK